uniref:Uncharacterized protein n=1 Tax=Anguilla anguilla TaxID=7936 RepID=A0A0E9VLM5_ANGAN
MDLVMCLMSFHCIHQPCRIECYEVFFFLKESSVPVFKHVLLPFQSRSFSFKRFFVFYSTKYFWKPHALFLKEPATSYMALCSTKSHLILKRFCPSS